MSNSTNLKVGFSNDIRQIGIVTRYEMLRHLRSKKMYVFAGFVALMLTLLTVLGVYALGGLSTDPKEFISNYVHLVSILVVIGVSLFCASAIASEFDERTALLLFPRPMKRLSLFVGKALACYIVCGALIALYYAVIMIMSLVYTGSIYPATFASLGLALLFMLGTGGFALLMSTLFNKGAIAVIITFATLFLIFNIIDSMGMMFNFEPVFSVTYAGVDIANVIVGNTTTPGYIEGMPVTYYYPSHTTAIAIMSAWAIVTTTLAALLFNRKEF